MRIDSKAILEQVRANLARLDACAGPHVFVPKDPGEKPWPRRYRCMLCGGDVDSHVRAWYERGLAHAKPPEWAIEFRNGFFLQSLDAANSGPLESAMRFRSEREADAFMSANAWIPLNGGMAKKLNG